jgi:adenosylcobinamide kinase/adenosylcobinamide-phosphate guanylyltransferase
VIFAVGDNEMKRGKLILITGGARSGKSVFAEKLAAASGKKVIYLATARIEDEEMFQRVERHRRRRPPEWITIEEPLEVAGIIDENNDPGRLILVDCLALLVTNLLFQDWDLPADEYSEFSSHDEERVLSAIRQLSRVAGEVMTDVIMVTNEVGWGLVPSYPVGRVYRDLLGLANQQVASVADAVYLVVSGLAIEIKSLGEKNGRCGLF